MSFQKTQELVEFVKTEAEKYVEGIEKQIPETPCRDGQCNLPLLYEDLTDEQLQGAIVLTTRVIAARVQNLYDNIQFRQMVFHLVEEKVKRKSFEVLEGNLIGD